MIGEYTLLAIAAPLTVVVTELLFLRTNLLRRGQFWLTVGISLGFQVPVDGWLTRSGRPIVCYDPGSISGIRTVLNIPIEDFGFGFALVAATLLLWARSGRRDGAT